MAKDQAASIIENGIQGATTGSVAGPWGAAAGAGISIIGGLLGGAASQGDRDFADAAAKEAFNRYKNLEIPDIEKLKLYLEELQSQGTYVPEAVANIGSQGASDLENVTLDPRLRNTQMDTLAGLQKIAESGMTDIDKNALEQMLRKSSSQQQANTSSILENRARRGLAGGGDELAAALAGTQGSANQDASNALSIAAQSAARRENALTKSSDLARSIESSDYNRRSNLADKRDSIANFNAALRQNLEGTNTSNRNSAQKYNLEEKQSLADRNVGLRNSQQQYNKNLNQTNFDNQLKKIQGIASAGKGASDQAQGRADATAGMYTGIANSIAGLANAGIRSNQANSAADDAAWNSMNPDVEEDGDAFRSADSLPKNSKWQG